MQLFLDDFDKGLREKRYIRGLCSNRTETAIELPN
jgi:hypothetical protein